MLKFYFDNFDRNQTGSIPCEMVGSVLRSMGQPYNDRTLRELLKEVDTDCESNCVCVCQMSLSHFRYPWLFPLAILGTGKLKFPQFVALATRFIVEEDSDALYKELKEAFRFYDKGGNINSLVGIRSRRLNNCLGNAIFKNKNPLARK